MRFSSLSIDGAMLVELDPLTDARGFFARAWCAEEIEAHGGLGKIVQLNISTNARRGTLRGLHVQTPPYGEAKFFRCLTGRSYHVVADVRPASSSYGRWTGVELAADRFDALYVPPYCAKGYQTLVDHTTVLYGVSSPYQPGAETGVRWNDPAFDIDWPLPDQVVVSEKDAAWPDVDLSKVLEPGRPLS